MEKNDISKLLKELDKTFSKVSESIYAADSDIKVLSNVDYDTFIRKISDILRSLEVIADDPNLFKIKASSLMLRINLCINKLKEGLKTASIIGLVNMLSGILKDVEKIEIQLIELCKNLELTIMDDEAKKISEIENVYQEQIRKLDEERINQKKQLESLSDNLKNEVNSIKDSNKVLLAEREMVIQQVGFLKVANSAQFKSWIWIAITASIIGGLIWFSYCFSQSFADDFKKSFDAKSDAFLLSEQKTLFYFELAKRTLLRFLVITILLVLLKYCLKNYNALMHAYTVNMHKASCLDSSLTIMRSFESETTKEIVMTLAAKEIFTMGKTGYLKNEETKFDLKLMDKLGASVNSKEGDS